jgi:hypothetical protein
MQLRLQRGTEGAAQRSASKQPCSPPLQLPYVGHPALGVLNDFTEQVGEGAQVYLHGPMHAHSLYNGLDHLLHHNRAMRETWQPGLPTSVFPLVRALSTSEVDDLNMEICCYPKREKCLMFDL